MCFCAVLEGRLIEENPFKGIPCKVQSVPEHMRFMTGSDIEWRLVISLARWGGLRIPSEIAESEVGSRELGNKPNHDSPTEAGTHPRQRLARHTAVSGTTASFAESC